MLSVFPELLTFSLVAPFILRITIGGFMVFLGIRRRKVEVVTWDSLWSDTKIGSVPLGPVLAKIQIVIGIFIFIGLYTQIAVLLALAFIWLEYYKKSKALQTTLHELWLTIFMTAINISLLFLGAGLLAFDLPL